MLRHAEASAVVEFAYNDKAILEQRNMLTQELYGNIFQIYKVMYWHPSPAFAFAAFNTLWHLKQYSKLWKLVLTDDVTAW